MPFKKYYILALIFAMVSGYAHSQTEAEMKVQADKLFSNGQYLEATPLYMRLLSLQPRDYSYNYKYGACLIYNSNRKQEAIKYLSFATGDPSTPPETYYFLGKALHLNYQFNEAIKNYTLYIQKNTTGTSKFDAEREIQMCQNGKRLMTTISDIIVTDKKEITSDKFFRIYELKDIGGSLLVTAEFQSKLDKKNNHTPLIHFPQNPSVIYYSSYGEGGSTGKDIYVRRKLPDGSWGLPQAIPGNVNTNEDEDFPYMHPDGNYLYFSSKGHNSMGGYDVFRSKYDPESNSYGPPENMDFAISSPDDDLFYVVDSLNQDAYFASARQSEKGKLYVYKVKVDRVPIQLAVIKGSFVSEVDPKIKKINFQIKDYANGDDIGKFNSNEKASYLITFPKGGKYEYVMTIEGSSQEFRSVVSIPFMKEFKPLKQKIVHTMEDGREVVKIINLFNEEVEDPAAVIAEVIKMRSELNVNVNEFDLEELEKEKQSKQVLQELGLGEMMLIEVSNVLNQEVKKVQENRQLVENIENNVNNLIVENAEEHKRLEDAIKQNVAEANKTQSNESKYLLLKEAEKMIKQQEELKLYSKNLLKLNDSVKGVLAGSLSQSEQKQLSDLATNFDELVKNGKNTEALELLNANKDLVKKTMSDNSMDLVQNLVDQVVKIEDEINTQKAKVDKYNRDLSDLEIEISSLQNSIYNAKKKDVPAIEAKIASKKEEMKLIEGEKDVIQKLIDKKTQEKYKLNKQIEILQDAISNKSVVPVSKEKALTALKETEKTNSNTINAYVGQQIAELEKQDPTLKDRVVVSSGLTAQNIYSEYKLSLSGIDSDSKLSKEDKLYKHVANERKTIKQLEARAKEIEELLGENKIDEKLNKEKQAITAYLKEIEVQNSLHEKQIENLIAQNGVGDPQKVIKDLLPEYEDNQEFLEANANLSEQDKLQALNKEDTKLLNVVEQELKKVDAQLIKEPNNTEIKKKQQTLNQIKQQTESKIDKRNELLNQESSTTSLTRESVLNELDPTYSKDVNTIEKDPSLTQKEKLISLNKRDETLLSKIDSELKRIESELKTNPSNAALLQEQTLLKQLKADKESAVSQRNAEINKESSIANNLTQDQLIEQIDASYSDQIKAIENNDQLNQKEKLEALNKRDQDLMNSVSQKENLVDDQLKANPTNAELKREKELLDQIRKDVQNRIDQRNTELNKESSSSSTLTADQLLKQIDPNYNSDIAAIKSNGSLTQKEKLETLNKRDQAFLTVLNTNLSKVEKDLITNPSSPELLTRKELLEQLRTVKEQDIQQRNAELGNESSVASNLTSQVLLNQIDPTYSADVASIKSNNRLSEEQKLTGLITRDEDLLSLIRSNISEVENEIKTNPNNSDLKRKLELLKELEASTDQNIVSLQQEISNLTITTSAISQQEKSNKINELFSDYSDKVNDINTNVNLTQNEKNDQLNSLDQALIQQIDNRLNSINDQLENDPSNSSLQKEKTILESIKTDKQNDIAKRKSENTSTVGNESADLIKEIDPDYSSDVEKINKNTSLSDKEKLTQLQLKDQELLKSIDSEINALDKKIAKDPENKELISQKEELNNLKSVIEEKTEERNQILNSEVSSELTAENLSAKKEELRSELDPTYIDKKDQIQSSNLSVLEKLKKELELEEAMLDKIEKKENSLRKALDKDPLNNELKRELLILEELKKETNSNIELLKDAIKNNGDLSELNRTKLSEQIDPEYSDKVNSIENSSELSELEKLTQFKAVEEEFNEKLDQALQESNTELKQNPNNKELEVKNDALKQIKVDNERKISDLNEMIDVLESNKYIATTEEKEALIKALRPEYEENVASIQSQNSKTELEKLQLLQEEDQKLLGTVYNKIDQIEEQLKEDPKSSDLQNELRVLNALAKDLESKIELRQSEINEKENLSSVSQDQKDKEIERIDPTHFSDLNSINKLGLSEKETIEKQNAVLQDLLSKVNVELTKLAEQLKSDPNNQQLLELQKILNAIKSDLVSSIEENNERVNSLSTNNEIASKTDIDPRYDVKKNDILNDKSLSAQEKTEDLLKLENELLDKAQDKQLETKENLDRDPSNSELKRENEKYSDLVTEIEKEVSELKKSLTEPVSTELTAEKRDQIISELLPDYNDRKSSFINSNLEESKKVSEQIKLENELKSKLLSEQKSIEKALDKDPGNVELVSKLEQIKEMISNQDEVINRLKENQKSLDQKSKSEELISKVDNSYESDIEKINQSTSENKTNELIEREQEHQGKIENRLTEVEKSIEKRTTPELESEKEILKNILAESIVRENELQQKSSTSNTIPSEEENRFVENLREDLLKNNSGIVDEERSEIESLKVQDKLLESYITELKAQVNEQEKILAENPTDKSEENKLNWLKNELETAQTKQRKVKISIGELERLFAENDNAVVSKFDDPELNKINEKENELIKQLTSSDLDPKQKTALEKELGQIQKEKTLVENRLMSKAITENKENSSEQVNELKSSATTNEKTKVNSELAVNQEKQLTKESDQLVKEANATKNSEEKNYLLEQALEKQEKANEAITEALIENKIEELESTNGIESLETNEALEQKKRRYVIQVGELTRLIEEIDEELKTAKIKDAVVLKDEKQSLIEQKALIEKKIALVDQELATRQNVEKETTVDSKALETEVTVTEEKIIAMSDAYVKYNEKATEALKLEKEISSLEARINTEKADSKTLIAENLNNPSESNKARLDEKMKTIKELEEELASKNAALKLKQQEANENLPSNKEEAMKFQNLVKRGVQPIQKAAVVASLIQMPANGLAINTNGSSPYSANNPIPVDVKVPTGLVYRVQVGAFAKPIPQDLFKEFNPVSGEKLNNGITRYLAGYFNNSKKVVEARDQIKGLGYADAFAVAYCDGKRITLAEARILEANGQCKAKGENELILEVAESTAITTGKIDSTGNISPQVIKEQEAEVTYHLAPDAAKAEPVEKHPGLFYTVQVGVFNKPVNEGTVKGMSPLMTSRLPNGQIRYSAGMYNSVDEARPKKQEAIDKGVKDAFITAYYKGERITLAEAEKILSEKGVDVLENNRLKASTSTSTVVEQKVETEKVETEKVETEKVETTVTETESTEMRTERMQIVTKKTFDEFPREVLNRYNSHGSFYYDESDKKVKSAVYSSADQLPQVYYFKEDIDTVKWTVDANEKAVIFCATFAKNSLPGDFADWLLRFNYRREFVENEGMIKMRLYDVPEDRLEEMEKKLNQFGLNYTVETKTERELELEEK